jgi:hypothetical protein
VWWFFASASREREEKRATFAPFRADRYEIVHRAGWVLRASWKRHGTRPIIAPLIAEFPTHTSTGVAIPGIRDHWSDPLNWPEVESMPWCRVDVRADGSLTACADGIGLEHLAVIIEEDVVYISNVPALLDRALTRGLNDARPRCEPLRRGIVVHIGETLVPRFIQRPRERAHGVLSGDPIRDLRRLTLEQARVITSRAERVAVLLSGGIDSAAAAAAIHLVAGPAQVDLIHLRLPDGYRCWEPPLARSAARTLGRPLTEIQLSTTELLDDAALTHVPDYHPWLGWGAKVQRLLSKRFDAVVTGGLAEMFGRDQARAVFAGGAGVLRTVQSAGMVGRALRHAARDSIRSALRPVADSPALPALEWTGRFRALANPALPAGIPRLSPFDTPAHIALAESITSSGNRFEKSVLRAAFKRELPPVVVGTPRRSSTAFPASFFPHYAREAEQLNSLLYAARAAWIRRQDVDTPV